MKPNGKEGANGKGRIRDALASAEPAPAPSLVPEDLTRRYLMLETGLHKRGADKDGWICAPFSIEAETVDDVGRWGILLQWQDRNGVEREEVFAREMFAGECADLRARLASGGLTMLPTSAARIAFAEYLNMASTPKRARVVTRTGWHRIGAGRVFVLPGEVIGAKAQRVILENSGKERAPFNKSGTLAEWRSEVAALAPGNTRLLFSIACGFAGPLLELTGEDGGGFHYRGGSRIGKTTALRVAASVWGGEKGEGAKAFIRAWRATGNALEGIAAVHSDTLLLLDEMGQVDARELGEIAYLLSNGQGKTRADRAGAMRAQARFRVLFLSTGEVGLADKNIEAKKVTRAGQEVRFVDIPADAGAGLGIFEHLHEHESPDAFAEELRGATARCFGTGGPEFIEHLVGNMEKDIEFADRVRERIEGLVASWLKPFADTGGQVRSVARRFGMVAIAGEIASEAGITGWAAGDAAEACKAIFLAWLAQRGTTGAREDAQAVAQLREFIGRHGDSRFQDWRLKDSQSGEDAAEGTPPVERFRTINRCGWKKWEIDAAGRGFFNYLLTLDAMNEALGGLDKRAAVKLLAERGFLFKDGEGKNQVLERPPGVEKKIRVYKVRSSILGAADE